MIYSLRFLPEVEEDIIAGYTWYEVHHEFRRSPLRRFPYAIYFRIEDNEINVFGLFHCARDSHAIKANLRGRDKPENP